MKLSSGLKMAKHGGIHIHEHIKEKGTHQRRWKLTSFGKRNVRHGVQFSVMTYNILSQVAVENHKHLYKHCNPAFMTEDYRLSKIVPEILDSKSDIICLQEVEQEVFESRLRPVFTNHGYECVFKKKTGSQSDGCAISWHRGKFSLLSLREVEMKQSSHRFLDRENVGLIVALGLRHPLSSSVRLHVATTHLLFNPGRGDVKLCQLRLLLAELQQMARPYDPMLLCGDLNLQPHSPLFHFLETGYIGLDGLRTGQLSGQRDGLQKGTVRFHRDLSMQSLGISDRTRFEPDDSAQSNTFSELGFTHDIRLVSAYRFPAHRPIPITSMTGRDFNTVDYIFYNVKSKSGPASYTEGTLRLLAVYSLMNQEAITEMDGLPNAHMGSDHLSLRARFSLDFRR